MQYVHDLLLLYSNANGDARAELPLDVIDERLLLGRGSFGLSRWELLKLARKQMVGLAGIRKFFMRTPQPVLPHDVELDGELPADFPSLLVHQFDQQQTASIKRGAMQLGVSMNDLLVGDLFLALAKWRDANRHGQKDDWLRMSVPVSLRRLGDERMPAANVVSMIFLDRRGVDFDQPQELIQSVRDEMDRIKRNHLGLTFQLSLQAFKLLPGGVKSAVNAKSCSASGLVTNVGTVFPRSPLPQREGKLMVDRLTLDHIDIGAPNRPYQCVAFSLLVYGGRLAICTQYDSRVLDKSQARGLLDTYVAQLKRHAGA
jgi:hypothetical protein